MENKKKQLGKGIRALLENMEADRPQDKETVSRQLSKHVAHIPLAWIEPNPHQPRKDFENEALENLVQSIRTHGIIQPLTLRRLSEESYQIIAGERRWRAARQAGLEEVPAYVRIADDQSLLEMALVENIQREDLNALEVAISMNRLITECELTHEQLSERLGKNRSTVTNYLRLLKLPPEIQRAVRMKAISMGHARALAGIDDVAKQLMYFRKTVNDNLSVRALELLLQQPARKQTKTGSGEIDPEIRKIRDELSGYLGSKVDIKRKSDGSGAFMIHFKDDRSFNSILDMLRELEE